MIMASTKAVEILNSDHPRPDLPKRGKTPALLHALRFGFRFFGPIFPSYFSRLGYKLFSTPRIRARHQQSDEVLEQARLFEFMYGRDILKAYEWGTGDRIILLVHGWESRGTALRSFVPGLVAQGFKVVAFDGPAHGNSAGKRTNLPHFGGAIRAIIRRLGGVHGIIAHSFGGASTVFTLANLDDSIALDKLVLIAAPSNMEYIYEDFVKMVQMPDKVAQKFRVFLESRINTPLAEAHSAKAFPNIKVKDSLLVHDQQDPIVPYQASLEVLESWEDIRLLATQGYGHFHLVKNPDVIQRVLKFVGK